MKAQVFFIGSQNIFGGIAVPFPDRLVCVTTDAVAAECRAQLKSPKLPLQKETNAPTPSGGIAKPGVELFHCGCGKLLVPGRKVLTIAAYFSATHLERFRITHIARMQNV